MMDIERKHRERIWFLDKLYDITDGNRSKLKLMSEICEELDIDKALGWNIVEYLDGEGLIEIVSRDAFFDCVIRITHYGISEVEEVSVRGVEEETDSKASAYSTGRPLKAFISYKREDDVHNKWVERFAADLRKAGIESILDRWEVRFGDSFTDYMTARINEADVVLFIMTTASVASVEAPKRKGGAVKFEMQIATARRTAGERMRLIGIYREGDKTPAHLRDHRYADFRDDSKYSETFRDLVSDLLGGSKAPPVGEQSAVSTPMLVIPAGEFQMGSNDGHDDEKPVHAAYLDSFCMEVYEVTNGNYTRFLNEYGKNTDTEGNMLLHVDSDYCMVAKVGNTYMPKAGYENHPVVMVSWYGAAAYAQFYSRRLPTEAEWEKAARGGLVGTNYPWGSDITHDRANYSGTGGRDIWNRTSPVGSFPPNGYGLYDMAGNVWEWCADWYDRDYYKKSPERNPSGPNSGLYRVLRGGSWESHANRLRVAGRHFFHPVLMYSSLGFRCARDVKQ